MRKIFLVFPALFALAFCVVPGLAFAGDAPIDVLTKIVDVKALTNVLIIPAIAWTVGFVKDHVTVFLQNRQYKKALALYELLQQASGAIYDEIIKPAKEANPGQKIGSAIGAKAMAAAVEKVKELAEKEGKTSLLPPALPELQLKIQQVITDRKKGLFSPIFSEK